MASQDYEQVTYNAPSGAQIAATTTDKVGFHAAVPSTQQFGTLTTTTLVALTTTQLSGLTTTQVAAYNTAFTALNAIAAGLVVKGL